MIKWIRPDHKIILGTPRSGTSFVTTWYWNKFQEQGYQALGQDYGFEYFEPDSESWPYDMMDKKGANKETKKRIKEDLTKLSVFKLHPGPEMSKHIFDYIKNRPVIVVKRKDVLGQFISFGIGWTTNKWAHWKSSKHKNTTLNGLSDKKFTYKKVWFDNLKLRYDMFKKEVKKLKVIEREVWFEDLPNWPINGDLMSRQSPQSNEEKLTWIDNQDEFLSWYNDFENSNKK